MLVWNCAVYRGRTIGGPLRLSVGMARVRVGSGSGPAIGRPVAGNGVQTAVVVGVGVPGGVLPTTALPAAETACSSGDGGLTQSSALGTAERKKYSG